MVNMRVGGVYECDTAWGVQTYRCVGMLGVYFLCALEGSGAALFVFDDAGRRLVLKDDVWCDTIGLDRKQLREVRR